MAAAQQTGILPQSQEPNATKTPQSMGLDDWITLLQRQQEAAAGLQQSIGLGMSAFARPENRERVFKTFTPGAPMDPAKMGESLMALSSQTQGQDRMNALGQMVMDPQRGPGIASQLNIGWDELKARFQADPGGTGQMIQSFLTPTDAFKNLQSAQRMQGAGGAGVNSPTFNDIMSGIVSNVAGPDNAAMMSGSTKTWRNDRLRMQASPISAMPWQVNDPRKHSASTPLMSGRSQAIVKRRRTSSSTKNETATRLQGDLETLKTSPGLQSILTRTPGLNE